MKSREIQLEDIEAEAERRIDAWIKAPERREQEEKFQQKAWEYREIYIRRLKWTAKFYRMTGRGPERQIKLDQSPLLVEAWTRPANPYQWRVMIMEIMDRIAAAKLLDFTLLLEAETSAPMREQDALAEERNQIVEETAAIEKALYDLDEPAKREYDRIRRSLLEAN